MHGLRNPSSPEEAKEGAKGAPFPKPDYPGISGPSSPAPAARNREGNTPKPLPLQGQQG